MNILLAGALIIAIIIILTLSRELYLCNKKISRIQKRHRSSQNLLFEEETTQETAPKNLPSIDKFDTHDKIIELYESGATIESISEELKIPQSKVEMTLKFKKMKKYGS